MGTGKRRKQDDCRVVVGAEEAAAARSAWPDAPIVALVEATEPDQAVLARCAGADVVVPTADLAAGWRNDTPGLATAVTAASALAERRSGLSNSSRRAAHDLGQALSAINLASELAVGDDVKNERLLHQIQTQAHDAGIHAWRAGHVGRATACALRPVDLSSLLHRVATTEPDVAVFDSTGSVWVFGDEARLERLMEELVQHRRQSATNQRVDVRFGPSGTVRLTLQGTGKERAKPSGTDGEFGLMAIAEIVNELGGTLEARPATATGESHPPVELSFPVLPRDDGNRERAVTVPPDRMAIQTAILEGVLRHAPLAESLEAIVAAIEQQIPGTKCSVLLLDDDERCLNHCAGAGLPAAYRDEIDGVAIGYGQGSCGTAAYLGRPIIAADVATDPYWVDFKDVALEHDLRSCWSTPILAADGGAVLGTFAVYRAEVWEPDEAAVRLVSRFTYLAAVAIGHQRLFTAVAESESRFRGAFEGATAGMALVGLGGSFLMVNPALCIMLDTSAEALSDQNLLDLIDPAQRDLITESWSHLSAAPMGSHVHDQEPMEVRIVRRQAEEPLWASLRSSLVATEPGQQPYLYIELRDITASRRHAVERRAREAAEAASRAKSDLLALVSHELRTPLNAILGFAQVMQLLELDAAQRAESVANIVKAGHHLLELINELLDLSLIEAGQLSTTLEDIDADEVIDEALQIVKPLADSRRITLHRELGATPPKHVVAAVPDGADCAAVLHADRQCVRQVLINLLGNAVKFTPPGGEVGIVVSQAADHVVRINVFDSGPGIAADAIDGLFQPFHRLAPNAQPAAEGTGLGLSVAARLVEEMHGRIGVESTLGAGSCFWVDLPGLAALGGASLTDGSMQSTAAPAAVEDDTTSGVVLYVEDDPACVQVMTAALALRPGVTFLTASNMAEAVGIVGTRPVDAVLLDIGLPDGSGWDLLRHLAERSDPVAIPVVVLTAGPGIAPPDIPSPEHILIKPLDIGRCIDLVDELLNAAPHAIAGH
ncbi:MAG: ATP-binding protein [Acidimicrobiales bacterium]